jgi:hypothetical protein
VSSYTGGCIVIIAANGCGDVAQRWIELTDEELTNIGEVTKDTTSQRSDTLLQ